MSSAVTEVEVVAPTGEDLAAYRYVTSAFGLWSIPTGEVCPAAHVAEMLGNDVLRVHPESTYAAYVVWSLTSESLSHSEDAAIADSLVNGVLGVSRCIPCPPSVSLCVQPGNLETRGTQALEWTTEWIGIVLRAHPDIWFADEMRLRLALDRYIAGDVPGAVAAMEALGKDGRPEVAAKAREVLALLRTRGMIR